MAIDNQFGKGISVAAGFDLGAQKPLDTRTAVNTIAERDAHVTGNRAYEGMLVYVAEDKKTYQCVVTGKKTTLDEKGKEVETDILGWKEAFVSAAQASSDLTAAKNALQSEIDALETLVGELPAEAAEGATVVSHLTSLVGSEATTARAAEEALQGKIDALDTLVGDLPVAGEGVVTSDTVVGYVDAKVDAEQQRALGVENALQGEIDALETLVGTFPIEGDEPDTDTLAGYLKSLIDAEAKARGEEDVELQGDIEALETLVGTLPVAGEGVVTSNTVVGYVDAKVDAEQQRALGVEGELSTAITTEEAARKAADQAIQTQLDALEAEVGDASVAEVKDEQGNVTTEGKVATGLHARIEAIEESIGDGGDLEKRVAEAEEAIETINGEGEGSIKKAVADLVGTAPDTLDTIQELATALRNNADVLEAIETAFDGKLATLQADVDQNEADCDAAIKAEKERAEGQEAAIRGEFAAADTALHATISAEIDADVKVVADELAKQKDDAQEGTLANKIKAHETSVNAKIGEEVTELEETGENANNSLTALIKRAVIKAKNEADAVQNNLNTLQTNMAQTIANLEASIVDGDNGESKLQLAVTEAGVNIPEGVDADNTAETIVVASTVVPTMTEEEEAAAIAFIIAEEVQA